MKVISIVLNTDLLYADVGTLKFNELPILFLSWSGDPLKFGSQGDNLIYFRIIPRPQCEINVGKYNKLGLSLGSSPFWGVSSFLGPFPFLG